MEDIASRVKDLNARLGDIRREQVFQRVSPHIHFPSLPFLARACFPFKDLKIC